MRILAAPEDALFCVGDEDQTLYGWRRASVRRMIELDLAYPGLRARLARPQLPLPAGDRRRLRAARRPQRDPLPEADRGRARSRRRRPGAIELQQPATQAAGAERVARRARARRRAARSSCSRARPTCCGPSRSRAPTAASGSAPPRRCSSRAARGWRWRRTCGCAARPRRPAPRTSRRSSARPTAGCPTRPRRRSRRCCETASRSARRLEALEVDHRQRVRLASAGGVLDALADDHRRAAVHRLPARQRRPRRVLRRARGGVRRDRADRARGARAGAGGGGRQDRRGTTARELEARTDALRAIRDDEHGIELTTIHRAKGRQWPAVQLFACEEHQLPHHRALEVTEAERAAGEGLEAERRLAYVAFTRAQRSLDDHRHRRRREPLPDRGGPRRPSSPYQAPRGAGGPARGAAAGHTHADPKVAHALGEAERVGLSYAIRTAPDRGTALEVAATAIERRLVGDRTTSERMTVTKLFAAVEQLERLRARRGARRGARAQRSDARRPARRRRPAAARQDAAWAGASTG